MACHKSFSDSKFKILFAIDASEATEKAFKFYFDNVYRQETGVLLVHCPDKPNLPTFSWKSAGHYPAEEIAQVMHDHNKKAQDVEYKYTAELEIRKVPHHVKIIDSDHHSIGHRLIAIAEEEKVDMIVMGSRGLKSIMRTLLHSSVAMACYSAFADSKFKVLFAMDASEATEKAFKFYFDTVHRPETGVLLVHCPDKPNLPTFSWKSGAHYPADEIAKVMHDHNKKSQDVEYKYTAELEMRKVAHHVKIIDSDHHSAGHRLIAIAEEEKVDMIVMGSRGLKSIMRTLLNSVSDYVLHHAHTPVLVCPVH